MRASNHSECSQDGCNTPMASPGRSWAFQPSAAELGTGPLDFDLQDSVPWSEDSAGSYAAAAEQSHAASPPVHSPRSGVLGMGAEHLEALPFSDDLRSHSPCSMISEQECRQDILQLPQDLSAVAVPRVQFMGFGTQQQLAALKSTGSIQLETPRLHAHRALLSSNCSSSSSGTVVSSDTQPFGRRGGSWGAAGMQHNTADMCGSHSTANWSANQDGNERVAAGSIVPAGSAGAGSGLKATTATRPWDVMIEGAAAQCGNSTGLAAGVSGVSTDGTLPSSRDAASVGDVVQGATLQDGTVGSFLQRVGSPAQGAAKQDAFGNRGIAGQGITKQNGSVDSAAQGPAEQDDPGSSGYWSCEEEEEGLEDYTAQPALHGGAGPISAQQTLGAPCTPTAAGAGPAAASAGGDNACQLSPLTSQSLAQLMQSFTDAGEVDPPHPADDDASTCCDWATVYSYEDFE